MASIKKIEGKAGTSYKITVTRGTDSTGKQIRHFKTWKPDRPMTARQMEKEVQKVALEFEREIDLGFLMDNRKTFEEYANYVISLKERQGAAPNSLAVYRRFMGKITPIIGHMKLLEIRPQHLNYLYQELEKPGSRETRDMARPKIDFKAALSEQGKSKRAFSIDSGVSYDFIQRICNGESIGEKAAKKIAEFMGRKYTDLFEPQPLALSLSPSTIRRLHSFVSVVFAQAEKEMLIPYNPASKATPPPKADYSPQYFQPEELEKILEALKTEPLKWRTIVLLIAVSGCRRGEIMGLRWSNVDFESKEIRVENSLSYLPGVGIYEGPTKTRKTRVVTLPDEMVTLLRKYRSWQMEQRLKRGDQWTDTGFVFTRDNGNPIIPGELAQWLKNFSKRNNLPHINPHAFRHTAASILISKGVDIVTVSKMLGHANTSTTTNIYSHLIDESKHKATECIADAILRKGKA